MNYRYIIVKTDDAPKAEDFLTPYELKQYQQFTVEKRAKEWLAGRYAAKKLATDFFTFPMTRMQVKNAKNGMPVLQVEGGNHLTISITHSGDYAAAAIALADDLIGVDVEKVEDRAEGWAKEYFTEKELAVNTPAFLTELWAKKEAILKLLQIGLTIPAKDIEITGGEIHFYNKALDIWALKGSPKIAFETKNLDGGYKFVLAYPDVI